MTPDELIAHYAAVRRRLWAGMPPPPPPLPPEPEPPPAEPERVPLSDTQRIIAEVAARHELTYEQLTGTSKKNPVVNARQEAMWELRTQHGKSFAFIARFFNRDHTTVLHGVRRWERVRKAREANGR